MISADTIRPYLHKASDIQRTEELLDRFSRLKAQRSPFHLNWNEFDKVAHWKLAGQYGRSESRREANSSEVIEAVTEACFMVVSDDPDYELEVRIRLLSALTGVGVGLALAILALVEPQKYAVIDFRVWRHLFESERTDFSVTNYKSYMAKLRALATQLGWTPQEVDHAIWEYDVQLGQSAGV